MEVTWFLDMAQMAVGGVIVYIIIDRLLDVATTRQAAQDTQ